jgi:hypothetical protein
MTDFDENYRTSVQSLTTYAVPNGYQNIESTQNVGRTSVQALTTYAVPNGYQSIESTQNVGPKGYNSIESTCIVANQTNEIIFFRSGVVVQNYCQLGQNMVKILIR